MFLENLKGDNAMKTKEIKMYVLAALTGSVAVFGLTLLIYQTFFHDFLASFNELSPEVIQLISREQPVLAGTILANLAHGFLLATMIRWCKFYTPLRGAAVGAVIGALTEIYFCFTQYTMFKTMNVPSALLDTVMWSFVNAIVGALVAWIIAKGITNDDMAAASPQW